MSRLLRWIRNYFVMIGFLVTVIFSIAFWQAGTLLKQVKKTSPLNKNDQIYLNLKLSGNILENSPEGNIFETTIAQLFGKQAGPYVLEMKSILDKAANDSRVKGLFLEFDDLNGSFPAFEEIRSALNSFKDSGKPVFAWMYNGDNKSYYLASVADKIYFAPLGDLSIPGPTFQLTYFADALQKIGVNIDIIRSGKFKSAIEPFILNKPSSASTEMYTELGHSLRTQMSSIIASSRNNMSPNEFEKLMKKTIFSPQTAFAKGLVDKIVYLNEAQSLSFPDENIMSYDFYDYQPEEVTNPKSSSFDSGIAIIEATGEIHLNQRGDENVITPQLMEKKLTWAEEDDQVKAVVIRISSPGGSALASDLIWDGVNRLKQKKPVVVSMGSSAASGGYYIAAPAHKIFASPTTITGSIGVFGIVPNLSKFSDKYGVSFHTFSQSDRINLLNTGSKPSEADKNMLEESVNLVYQTFIEKVAKGRKLKVSDVHKIAQGRVWTGKQAQKIGLVDELGGLYEAIQGAKKLASIDAEIKVPLLHWKQEMPSLSECFTNFRKCIPVSTLAKYASQLNQNSIAPMNKLQDFMKWNSHLKEEPIQAFWTGKFTELGE